jgi:hypothetical protein
VARIKYKTRIISPLVLIEVHLFMLDQAQHSLWLCLKPATAEAFSALTSARYGQRLAFLQGRQVSQTADVSPADTCGNGDTCCATGCSQTCLLSASRRTFESRPPGKNKSVSGFKSDISFGNPGQVLCHNLQAQRTCCQKVEWPPSTSKTKRQSCRLECTPRQCSKSRWPPPGTSMRRP